VVGITQCQVLYLLVVVVGIWVSGSMLITTPGLKALLLPACWINAGVCLVLQQLPCAVGTPKHCLLLHTQCGRELCSVLWFCTSGQLRAALTVMALFLLMTCLACFVCTAQYRHDQAFFGNYIYNTALT
jgi:hypothetical protein